MDLREAYRLAFTAPYASHRWRSIRGRPHWVDLEPWQDAIAGPLCSIVNSGGCDYVYARDDAYFTGVTEPRELHARLLEWHARLARGVDRFVANTPSQVADLRYMRDVLTLMRNVIEQGLQVENARWLATRTTGR